MIWIVLRAMLLSLGLFSVYILIAWQAGLAGGWLDWLALVTTALLPLLEPRIRAGSPALAAIVVLATGALMFTGAFLLIAVVFGEGL